MTKITLTALLLTAISAVSATPQFFPIVGYELPKSDPDLRGAVAAGFNLFRCRGKEDLDRVAAAGAKGWMPVPIQLGDDPKLRAAIEQVRDHTSGCRSHGPRRVERNSAAPAVWDRESRNQRGRLRHAAPALRSEGIRERDRVGV